MSDLSKFHRFSEDVSQIELPEKFTFPFYYKPHPLSLLAAKELQVYLEELKDINHNFGLDNTQKGMVIGKMFGVLVVSNQAGELGYLAAFSGKLADSNDYEYFVPPVYDMLKTDGFYREGERKLYQMSDEIIALEKSPTLQLLKQTLVQVEANCQEEMRLLKEQIAASKMRRQAIRLELETNPTDDIEQLLKDLNRESFHEQFQLKALKKSHKEQIEKAKNELDSYLNRINELKIARKKFSNAIQDQIFNEYHFLNAHGETRNVLDLFRHIENGKPPSGAGECCAPKLLQYAYLNKLKPIALAEFWWGASPASEIRKHEQFYPACRGKCEPILTHMLQGLDVDKNPMLDNPAEGRDLEIIYEDDAIAVINKPADFLSVPGKTITDSVLSRMQEYLPDATGPLLLHRLDMSTSGILLLAKTKEGHAFLQRQFIRRTVEKRYVALLEGELTTDSGVIDLPLRVDLDDRPRQLVCWEHGKQAITKWELIEVKEGKSKVYFYPLTGRTHQLRVHAAHTLGLGCPIVGDDLYGNRSNRLHLHAEQLTFTHPRTRQRMTFNAPVPF
ncbi:MAG TPA: pseudouridine synthase [Taishania sp.]|nr:pseudouridine synthase [Taishania sp.]